MNTAHSSESSFGRHLSEAVLATALALPVVFAFNELRGTWFARGGALPQSDNPHLSRNGEMGADRFLPSVVLALMTPEGGEGSESGPGVIAHTKEVSLEANNALKKAPGDQARVKNGQNRVKAELVSEDEGMSREDRLARPLHR